MTQFVIDMEAYAVGEGMGYPLGKVETFILQNGVMHLTFSGPVRKTGRVTGVRVVSGQWSFLAVLDVTEDLRRGDRFTALVDIDFEELT